jgi:valyl-tRNA synthetase
MINPQDPRAQKLAGMHAMTPLFNRTVPIIADAEVESGFGTGAVMTCSYGDKVDVAWIYRYKLETIEALGLDGKVKNAGEGFDGLSIAAMREKVIQTLKENGKLLKQEKNKSTVKTHDRCGKPVDFLATNQWFIKLKDSTDKIVAAAHKMRWIPGFSIQYLDDWAKFIDYDWVISRQRVYGTPIPFYYCESCDKVYPADYSHLPLDPATAAPNQEKCSCGGNIIGETSTCDCWVDSSITPLVIAGWPENQELYSRVYPVSLRPQGLEIIRTWAFYTIARCLALTGGEAPFEEVLINGSVLGTDGKKMSKSAGNYEDPDALMAKYAPDALRQWAALSGAVAKDRPFSYKDVEYSQSFLNKLFNASKFAQKSLEGFDPNKTDAQSVKLRTTDAWLLSRTAELVKQCTNALNEYDYYTAINAIQGFAWHELCDYYLEEIKFRIYSEEKTKEALESKKAAQFALYHSLNAVIKLLAPFAPFVTEEIYCSLFSGHEGAPSVHSCSWPKAEEGYINKSAENIVGALHLVLGEVRRFKAGSAMALNEPLTLAVVTAPEEVIRALPEIEQEILSVGHVKQINTAIGNELKVQLTV